MEKTMQSPDATLFKKATVQKEEREHIAGVERSAFSASMHRLFENKLALFCIILLSAIIVLSIVAPILSPYKYYETNYAEAYMPPSPRHFFGTDKYGRDMWTRIWCGTRVSLYIGVMAALINLVIGVVYGSISATIGGKTDMIMQRIIEILCGIPYLMVVILLMMIMKPGVRTIILAFTFTGWCEMARLVRGEILKLKNQEFVMASQLLGTRTIDIIRKDMLPNMVGVIIINMMFAIPNAIFSEAFLSFIGLGLSEPNSSLGVLINNGYAVYRTMPYMLWYPAIVIVLIMVCFNVIGDALRDALDPRMRR